MSLEKFETILKWEVLSDETLPLQEKLKSITTTDNITFWYKCYVILYKDLFEIYPTNNYREHGIYVRESTGALVQINKKYKDCKVNNVKRFSLNSAYINEMIHRFGKDYSLTVPSLDKVMSYAKDLRKHFKLNDPEISHKLKRFLNITYGIVNSNKSCAVSYKDLNIAGSIKEFFMGLTDYIDDNSEDSVIYIDTDEMYFKGDIDDIIHNWMKFYSHHDYEIEDVDFIIPLNKKKVISNDDSGLNLIGIREYGR